MKTCTTCNIEKEDTNFYSRHSICKDCNKIKSQCVHGIRKSNCKDCKKDQKKYCTKCKKHLAKKEDNYLCDKCNIKKTKKECNKCHIEKEFSDFYKNHNQCKDCHNDTLKCEHDKFKSQCKECSVSYCKHGVYKSRCTKCENAAGICKHKKRKGECVECDGSQICKHKILKSRCKECDGSQICKHNNRKDNCYDCNPNLKIFCISEMCEKRAKEKRYRGYCSRCFFFLFPDEPITRNYKTKENTVSKFIEEEFKEYNISYDHTVRGGTSGRRPDIKIELEKQIIIIEVDENQHKKYECICENKRIMMLSQDYDHKKIVFIRFNPDAYKDFDNNNIKSCWSINKDTGSLYINSNKKWKERLNNLKEQTKYWINNETDKTIEIIQLYYDMNL